MNFETNLDDVNTEGDSDCNESASKWKKGAIEVVAGYPRGVNFFLAECYFKSDRLEKEPLLSALISGESDFSGGLISALAARRFSMPSTVDRILDGYADEIGFKFVTPSYPFVFAENVLAPLCQDPETALFTRFVNARKKGFAEKHISFKSDNVQSTAYWGMKRKASLPMQLWTYDLVQCDPDLEAQEYSRKVFPLLTPEHMSQYQKTGRICEDKDYQFFLHGKYSYLELAKSWSSVKDLEEEWEELNVYLGMNNEEEFA